MKALKLASAGVFLLSVIAVAVVFAPVALGQTTRVSPNVQLRTLTIGGSQIGVELRDVDATDVARESLDEQAGAVITEVRSGGPAAAAGFRAGDVVITFDGERVRSARHLSRLIEDTPDGRSVPAVVIRAGERVSLAVAPAEPESVLAGPMRDIREFAYALPDNLERFDSVRPRVDDNFRLFFPSRAPARLGVGITELTDQLGEYFGAANGGVLVSEVTDDSPASRAGLKAGDVITRVGNTPVRSTGDLQRQIFEASGDVELTVLRERREMTIRVTIGERQPWPSAVIRR